MRSRMTLEFLQKQKGQNMKSEFRAFWNEKIWEVMSIDYRFPQTVLLSSSKKTTDYVTTPLSEITLLHSTGKNDITGADVFEGDIIENPDGLLMEIKYGLYDAYCPADECDMDSVGFYAVRDGLPQMPIGCLEDYAMVIGNIYENPDLLKADYD